MTYVRRGKKMRRFPQIAKNFEEDFEGHRKCLEYQIYQIRFRLNISFIIDFIYRMRETMTSRSLKVEQAPEKKKGF